jgi:hypothetical protein
MYKNIPMPMRKSIFPERTHGAYFVSSARITVFPIPRTFGHSADLALLVGPKQEEEEEEEEEQREDFKLQLSAPVSVVWCVKNKRLFCCVDPLHGLLVIGLCSASQGLSRKPFLIYDNVSLVLQNRISLAYLFFVHLSLQQVLINFGSFCIFK